MAHFAQIDENNIVTRVVVIANEDTSDENDIEVESIGVAFCKSLFGENTNWVQTSYNGNIRKNYAGIGFKYDIDRDAFIPPQPFASWELVEESCRWKAPEIMPEVSVDAEGRPTGHYMWSEDEYNAGNGGWVFLAYEGE
jgi:hypothetical protein